MGLRFHAVGSAVVLLCGAVSTSGCSGDGPDDGSSKAEIKQIVSPEMVARSWPVLMSEDGNIAPFEQHSGWAALFKRDLPGALKAFQDDPADGRGLARVHSDLAALYRQSAWMGAQATRHIYGADRQDTDPLAADYLLGVSLGLAGQCSEASAALSKFVEVPAELQAHHDWWTTWAAADDCPAVPPAESLAALPGAPALVERGVDPEVGQVPRWTFVEQSADAMDVHSGELTSLMQIALSHEERAMEVASASEQPIVRARVGPWRLDFEGRSDPGDLPAEVDAAWLFLDFALVGEDIGFLDVAGRDGIAAVAAWQDKSLLAAALAAAVEDDKLVPEKVIDQAAELRIQLRAAMEARSGTPKPYQSEFAKIGEVAVLRAGMLVTDANDQYRDSGILRINAFERSDSAARDPVFLLSTAAWDAGNRSPLRAQEIVQGFVSRYPAVRAARYPLDALHIRLGRTAPPSTPVH
jgi:hypothetical protein